MKLSIIHYLLPILRFLAISAIAMITFSLSAESIESIKFNQYGLSFETTGELSGGMRCVAVSTAVDDDTPQQAVAENRILTIPAEVSYNGEKFVVTKLSKIHSQAELRGLYLPATLRSVEYIYDCPSLSIIDFGGATSIVGVDGLPRLTDIRFQSTEPLELTSTFNNVGLERYIIPTTSGHLGSSLFSNCEKLVSLDLSGISECTGTNNLSHSVCCDNHALENLIFPKAIVSGSIGECFMNLTSLKSVTLPESTYEGFQIINSCMNWPAVTTIYAPSVRPLEIVMATGGEQPAYALAVECQAGTYDNTDIQIQNVNIGGAEIDTDNCTVYVPEGCVEVYRNHPSWSMFHNIVEYDYASLNTVDIDTSGAETGFEIIDGTVYSRDGKPVKVYNSAGRELSPVKLPGGLYIVRSADGQTAKVLVH